MAQQTQQDDNVLLTIQPNVQVLNQVTNTRPSMELLLTVGATAIGLLLLAVLLFTCTWCSCPNSESQSHPDLEDVYAYEEAPAHPRNVYEIRPRSRSFRPIRQSLPQTHVFHESEPPSRQNSAIRQTRLRALPRPYSVPAPKTHFKDAKQEAYETRKREIEALVRAEQDDLLHELVLSNGQAPSPLAQGKYGLLIAADATPKQAGGYCVDLCHKTSAYYSLPLTQLPWSMAPTEIDNLAGDADEFEMKNLLFAILLWLPDIRKFTKRPKAKRKGAKRVLVCTDNFACRKPDNEYGQRVTAFLTHLRQCEGVLIDSRVFGTNEPNLRKHAAFLKPADDLSRNCTTEAKRFLTQLYGIPVDRIAPIEVRANVIHHRLTEECGSCGFQIEHSPSLKSFRFDYESPDSE